MFLYLSDYVIRKVGETKTVVELWTALEKQYLNKSLPNKCFLWILFFSFKFDPSLNTEENMDRFNRITQDLTNCGEKISDDQKVVGLLNALGDKYKDIRNALEYGKSDLTIEIIHNSLLTEELGLKSEYKEAFHVEDLGRSFHMTPNVDNLSDYSDLDEGSVKLGNDEVYHVKGIDNVFLKFKNDYSYLRTFGCAAYAHHTDSKLDLRSLKGVCLGYGEGIKGYKLWLRDVRGCKMITSRSVIFNEERLVMIQFEVEPHEVEPQNASDVEIIEDYQHLEPANDLQDYQLAKDREMREIRPPSRYQYADFVTEQSEPNLFDTEPVFYDEAVSCKESPKCIDAIEDEMNSLYKNQTWILVEKPIECKVIDCKWVYKIKEGDDKTNRRYKARLVVKGFTQREEIDYTEVVKRFSLHVAKPVSLPLSSSMKLSIDQSPKSENEHKRMMNVPYSNAVGFVMYVMVCSRPDIAYAMSVLSRFISNPGELHWQCMEILIKYLKGTSQLGLMFKTDKNGLKLKGYVDSDYAGNPDNMKSTTAYFYVMNDTCIS
ncbi:unnamed protein product [Fraxinus pennsylvanica]|uniref:Reverse transcriptase Ty1/copia-type domain-containing protein n=1 Tax=Fraxinus pennsylvanica TaxID=56036 RepID=A0AAD1ZPZ0_9LAMI|nr:unnamed protein product [Fraxinus pennsylvanica]